MKKLGQFITQWLISYLNILYFTHGKERRQAQELAMEHNPAARLLDLGCREGDGTIRLGQRVGTTELLGMDYNREVLALAARRGILSIQADLNQSIPLIDDCIDVITASDILEHLVNPFVFVSEMYRVLQPGGYIVLDTPNLASWHNIFALLMGVQPFSGPNITSMDDADIGFVQDMHRVHQRSSQELISANREKHELNRHIVVIAYKSLIKLFVRCGFEVVDARGFGYYPFPPPLARLLQRLDPKHAHHIMIKATKPAKHNNQPAST